MQLTPEAQLFVDSLPPTFGLVRSERTYRVNRQASYGDQIVLDILTNGLWLEYNSYLTSELKKYIKLPEIPNREQFILAQLVIAAAVSVNSLDCDNGVPTEYWDQLAVLIKAGCSKMQLDSLLTLIEKALQ